MTRLEDTTWWIGLIGSLASIGAAIWAFIEARRASGSAVAAEKIKQELIGRRKLVEVSQLYREANRVISSLTTVGPSCTESSV